jgi:hypothetical protein
MKKLVLLGGIGLVMVAILAVWALIAGMGFVSRKLPRLITGIENITGLTIEKAKEAVTGITEKAKDVSPAITEKIKGIIPGEAIPERDVGGEDITGIPRYPNMVRVSFAMQNGKRTIGYRGGVEFSSVIDFYNREMSALNFKKKVLSSSAYQEVHEYRGTEKALEFTFKKADILGTVMTEMVIREL